MAIDLKKEIGTEEEFSVQKRQRREKAFKLKGFPARKREAALEL